MQNEELEGLPSQEKSGVEKPKINLTDKQKKIIAAVAGLLFFLLLMLLVVVSQGGQKLVKRNIPIVTPPYFVVTATPPPQPTKWASDSGILKVKKDLTDLGKNLTDIDLSEPMLGLPNIDLRVTFQK